MTNLLIVESPGKLKTLRKILGPGWILEASVGHTTELASDGPKRMGFEIAGNEVHVRYVPRGDRGKQVLAKLKKAVKASQMVYLATDPDREGEAIAWHLIQQLKLKKFRRVIYTEITEKAVKAAIAHPQSLNESLINAQRARQCLDKLVGFEVSPLLWNTTGGKSAGRVQSATLHLVCERERERLTFKSEKYWTLKSFYKEAGDALFYQYVNDTKERRVNTEEEAKRLKKIAEDNPHVVHSLEKKEEYRKPLAPLITSSLQQMAGLKFRYSPQKTMKIAQELYEGIGGQGLITYMRTDAVFLSSEFVGSARDWIQNNCPEALAPVAIQYKNKEGAQGAHEAIRPTSAGLTPEKAMALGLSQEQFNIYSLIWQRAMAAQCRPARLAHSKMLIKCQDSLWVMRGMVVLEKGYFHFWKNLEDEKELPPLAVGEFLKFDRVEVSEKKTLPPSRYSAPKLVQLMEQKGVGRPSTYASTIETLKERGYVELSEQLLAPTELGMSTDNALSKAIPELVNVEFTAQMEFSLDQIAEGRLQWEHYLVNWSEKYLSPAIIKAKEELKKLVTQGTFTPLAIKKSNLNGEASLKVQKAFEKVKAKGAIPKCIKSEHGDLSLRLSKKGILYWKCQTKGCESIAWYQGFKEKPKNGFKKKVSYSSDFDFPAKENAN